MSTARKNRKFVNHLTAYNIGETEFTCMKIEYCRFRLYYTYRRVSDTMFMMWAKWRCLTLSSNKIKKTGRTVYWILSRTKHLIMKKKIGTKRHHHSWWVWGFVIMTSKSKYNFNEKILLNFHFFVRTERMFILYRERWKKMLINPTK